MAQRGDLSDNLIPQYKFEWDDGTVRTTDDLPDFPDGIEALAEMGRQDDRCEVTLTGYET